MKIFRCTFRKQNMLNFNKFGYATYTKFGDRIHAVLIHDYNWGGGGV